MPVHTAPFIEESPKDGSYNHVSEDDKSSSIQNLEHLNAVAAILRSDTVEVANPEEAKHAFEQQLSGSVERPRKIVLTGYAKALQCRFKGFLALPYEIRQAIWAFAMRDEKYLNGSSHLRDRLEIRDFVRKYTIGTSPRNPSFLPNVCRVSKFTRQETMEVFIQGTLFQICAIEQNRFMHSFLDNTPNGFEAVRRLQFGFFDCFPAGFDQNADLELAVRCSGLQELQISFHDKQLIGRSSPYEDAVVRPRQAQAIWDFYKMDRMLDFGLCFKKVTIFRKGYGSEHADQAALELARFVMQKFREEQGRRVDAVVVGNKYVLALDD